KSPLKVLDVLAVNKTFDGGHHAPSFRCAAWEGNRFSVVREKQALHGELSEPNRVGHSVRRQVQKLLPDGDPKFAIVSIIAEGVIRPQGVPNGGERLVHRCKRLWLVQILLGIL